LGKTPLEIIKVKVDKRQVIGFSRNCHRDDGVDAGVGMGDEYDWIDINLKEHSMISNISCLTFSPRDPIWAGYVILLGRSRD
jgi:hypothetical protein